MLTVFQFLGANRSPYLCLTSDLYNPIITHDALVILLRAAVFLGPPGSWPNKPMAILEVPMPAINPKEVLVEVAACGMCHTDIVYLKDGIRPIKEPPLILGHEPSGIVKDIGENVTSVRKGDRVIICYSIPCGKCAACLRGEDNLCDNGEIIGSSRDGAFAEYLSAPESAVFKIPDQIPLEESGIIVDAVAAPFHALVNLAKVKPGDTVVIYGGSGGLGLNAVQLAASMGARVIAVGRKMWKLQKALELGAERVVSTLDVSHPHVEIQKLTNGGADIVIEATGDPAAITTACRCTRRGGKVVVLSYAAGSFAVPSLRFLWYGLTIIGSATYSPSDLPRIIDFVKNGRVKLEPVVSHRFPLDNINEGYRSLVNGDILRGLILPR